MRIRSCRREAIIEYTPFNDTQNSKVGLLVECGQHWASDTGVVALDTALHFLRACKVVDPNFINDRLSPRAKEPGTAAMWDVTHGITASTDNFQFCEPFVGMEIIEKRNQDSSRRRQRYHDAI